MKTINKISAVLLAVTLIFGLAGPIKVLAATTPPLGASASFSILAQTAITNVPASVISGDVGMNSSGASITGLTTGEVAGLIYATDLAAPSEGILPIAVQPDTVLANADMLSQAPSGVPIPGALDGVTRGPGVYDLGAGTLGGGVLTLDGPGVYIFRTSSSLTSAGSVNLINGARACDVYWSVNTLATINSGGAGTSFAGTIIAGTGVHFGAGAVLDGRALAVGGDVTLISNTITGPSCAATTGSITVTKTVINDEFGTRTVADFPLFVNGVPVVSGATNIYSAPATYTVSETSNSNYTSSFSGDCNASGNIILAPGDVKTCTITNNDIAPFVTVPIPTGGWGVPYVAPVVAPVVAAPMVSPLIHVTKTPSPSSLPSQGGMVTYSEYVSNPGTVALNNVTLNDDKCAPMIYISGDMNFNSILEATETWKYTCQSNLIKTTTNTAVASGVANGFTVTDTAIATVVVAPQGQVLGVKIPGLPDTGIDQGDNIMRSLTALSVIIVLVLGSLFVAQKKFKI